MSKSSGGFSIKKPNSVRRTFCVHRKIYRGAGLKPLQPKLIDLRIDAINENFKLGQLDEATALRQIKSVIADIKEKENFGKNLVSRSLSNPDY